MQLGSALIVTSVLAFVAAMRYLRYLERRAYYEAMARRSAPRAGDAEDPAADASPEPLPVPPWALPERWGDGGGPRRHLRGGFILIAVGVALLLGLGTMGIGPWLLAGLIPLFIGLVQVMFALLDRR